MIKLIPLSPKLVNELKAVRLRALEDAPAAFGRTYTEEELLSDADWLNRATTWNNGNSSTCFIAIDKGTPCGMIAGYTDSHEPPRPNVAAMWVAPEQRRTGLGRLLMDEVVLWAQQRKTGWLRLVVTNDNTPAIRFYQSCGFTLTGNTEYSPKDPEIIAFEMMKAV